MILKMLSAWMNWFNPNAPTNPILQRFLGLQQDLVFITQIAYWLILEFALIPSKPEIINLIELLVPLTSFYYHQNSIKGSLGPTLAL